MFLNFLHLVTTQKKAGAWVGIGLGGVVSLSNYSSSIL